jgi:hypothetical protein
MQESLQNVQNLEHRGERGVDGLVLLFQIFERLIKAQIIIKTTGQPGPAPKSCKLVALVLIGAEHYFTTLDGISRTQ